MVLASFSISFTTDFWNNTWLLTLFSHQKPWIRCLDRLQSHHIHLRKKIYKRQIPRKKKEKNIKGVFFFLENLSTLCCLCSVHISWHDLRLDNIKEANT